MMLFIFTQNEMTILYPVESQNSLGNGSGVFTSYFQRLVSVLLLSNQLRDENNSICPMFNFESLKPAVAAVVEEVLPAVWSCEVCTFENPEAAPGCDMCGNPKPKAKPKTKSSGSPTVETKNGASKTLHDLLAAADISRFLCGEITLAESPAASALFLAAMYLV